MANTEIFFRWFCLRTKFGCTIFKWSVQTLKSHKHAVMASRRLTIGACFSRTEHEYPLVEFPRHPKAMEMELDLLYTSRMHDSSLRIWRRFCLISFFGWIFSMKIRRPRRGLFLKLLSADGNQLNHFWVVYPLTKVSPIVQHILWFQIWIRKLENASKSSLSTTCSFKGCTS